MRRGECASGEEAAVYPLYVQKAEKMGRTRVEVDEVMLDELAKGKKLASILRE